MIFLLLFVDWFDILLVHSEKQCLKQKQKSKKVKFIVDFCQMIWYITNAQRKVQ